MISYMKLLVSGVLKMTPSLVGTQPWAHCDEKGLMRLGCVFLPLCPSCRENQWKGIQSHGKLHPGQKKGGRKC